jgi:AraC-like DNA-binding protein
MRTSKTRTVLVSERTRWPRIGGAPHPKLRGLLARDYTGFTEATAPSHGFAGPATIILRLQDSPRRPAVLGGAHNTFWGPEGGACPPAYAELRLLPLGAYRLFGHAHGRTPSAAKSSITRFRQQVGLPPKTAARLVRFGAVWRRPATHPAARWDAIASDSGYADQAHWIRDFHQFTGASPTAFLAHPQTQNPVPRPRESAPL